MKYNSKKTKDNLTIETVKTKITIDKNGVSIEAPTKTIVNNLNKKRTKKLNLYQKNKIYHD